MIVQPDFPDHWKTQALIAATGDQSAPMMVIRLWGHCQSRRAFKFKNLSDVALAGICKWQKDPSQIRVVLEQCGFIHYQNGVLTVHDWDTVNSSLIARWRGGENNKRRLLGKPKLSQSLPISLAGSEKRREEKIGVDKIREEKKEEIAPPALVPSIEDIYSAYPKKVGKPDALKAISKAVKRFGNTNVLERTMAYAKARNGDLDFVPNPATWFNQERFNDDPVTWQPREVLNGLSPAARKQAEIDKANREYRERKAREALL
jgi:hypothetical protein